MPTIRTRRSYGTSTFRRAGGRLVVLVTLAEAEAMRLLAEARLEIRVEVLEGERVISAVVPAERLDSVVMAYKVPLVRIVIRP